MREDGSPDDDPQEARGRVVEAHRVAALTEPPQTPAIELARVAIEGSGALAVTAARNPWAPGPNEIDGRHRPASGGQVPLEVRVALIAGPGAESGSDHVRGFSHLLRACAFAGVRATPVFATNGEVPEADLLYVTGHADAKPSNGLVDGLRERLVSGSWLFADGCGAGETFVDGLQPLLDASPGSPSDQTEALVARARYVFGAPPPGACEGELRWGSRAVLSSRDYGCAWQGRSSAARCRAGRSAMRSSSASTSPSALAARGDRDSIRAGAARDRRPPASGSPSGPPTLRCGGGVDAGAQPMTQGPLSGAPRVHVAASPPLQQVDAGEGVVFTLTVTNLSDENQAQSIAVEGLPRAWVTIAFDEAREALPREQRNAIVTIAVPEGSQTAAMRFRAIARAGEEMSVTDCVVEVSGTTPEVDELVEELDQRPPPPGLALAPAEASLEAGGEANAELRLTVRNVGTRETVYSLALGGFEPTWYELPAQLRVAAGETIDTQLLLHPTVSAGDGVYPFMIRAVVDAFPDVMSDITGELTILAPSAVPTEPAEAAPSQARATAAAAIAPPELTLGPETTFRFGPGEITSDAAVGVENRSRLLEGYTISVEGLPDGWYALPVREIRLDPGATQQLVLRLTPKPGSQHPAGDYPFRVRVTPHGSTDGFAEVGG